MGSMELASFDHSNDKVSAEKNWWIQGSKKRKTTMTLTLKPWKIVKKRKKKNNLSKGQLLISQFFKPLDPKNKMRPTYE